MIHTSSAYLLVGDPCALFLHTDYNFLLSFAAIVGQMISSLREGCSIFHILQLKLEKYINNTCLVIVALDCHTISYRGIQPLINPASLPHKIMSFAARRLVILLPADNLPSFCCCPLIQIWITLGDERQFK